MTDIKRIVTSHRGGICKFCSTVWRGGSNIAWFCMTSFLNCLLHLGKELFTGYRMTSLENLIKFTVKCDFWRVFQSDVLFICSKSLYKIRNKFFSGTQLKEVTFESTNFIWSNMFSNFEWLFSACLFDHWVWLYLLKWNSGNRNNYLSFSKYW